MKINKRNVIVRYGLSCRDGYLIYRVNRFPRYVEDGVLPANPIFENGSHAQSLTSRLRIQTRSHSTRPRFDASPRPDSYWKRIIHVISRFDHPASRLCETHYPRRHRKGHSAGAKASVEQLIK